VTNIAILGAGSWGTALAIVLSRNDRGHKISLWAHDAALAASMQAGRENKTYLPQNSLPDGLNITSGFKEALTGAAIVIGAVPSAHARGVYTEAQPHLSQTTAAKISPRVAVLSGPSFAAEAARGEPTAVVIASHDAALAAELQEEFAAPSFRLYTNDDVLGVELAGAMKNVMAIAAGACQGLGLGSNALAALITRGLAEMTRLAVALGARPETLSGLAGLGDLVLTCTGSLSRNRYVGVELGKGRQLGEIRAKMRMVAEGVDTTSPLLALARENHIEMPITEQVDAILHAGKSPKDAIRDIMERPLKRE
jgi:glycerol-3-phosphate dehydrogenase (NAD(P)+)